MRLPTTKLMGILLGVSFQTELLIMALLGLANSTLDWKSFELIPRLNLIKELNFSDDNVQFTSAFSQRIRNLLTITVVVEFFCGLLNPLTHLLKLYPIITWSRSNFLLPWLLTHALNTILPKMLSVSLVFVFYKANKISTLSLLEFVVVESINLSIAFYNWYVFFEFYLNLREVESNRVLRNASEEKIIKGPGSLSQTYSSIPDLQEIFRETVIELDEFPTVRSARSLTYMIENDSQELHEDSSPTLSFDENLSPAERSMKILNLTLEDLKDAKKDKCLPDITKESDSSVEPYKAACSCTSSDNDDTAFFISKTSQTRKGLPDFCAGDFVNPQPSTEIHSRPRANFDPNNALTRSTQIAATLKRNSLDTIFNSPFTSFALNRSHSNTHGLNDDLYFLLSKNIELLDQMCRAISNKNKTVPKDNMEKWLIFQRELECNLHRHVLSKETSVSSKKNPPLTSESSRMAKQDLQNKIRNDAIKFKREFDHVKNPNDSKLASFSTFNKMLSRNTYAYHAQVPQSPNKPMQNTRPGKASAAVFKSTNMDNSKMQELWNLKIYNDFTLEQDRREMFEKNKRAKMVGYKNIAEMKKQVDSARCDVLNEECQNVDYLGDYLEMRKQRSRRSARKLGVQKKVKAHRPKMFSDKNLPKKLNYPSQPNRTNIKEQIKKINWNINMNIFKQLSPMKTKIPYQVAKVTEDSDRIDIFEDETLSELQNAFSHSDDNTRGFQLGPETNQPYPIFQIVAMTLTEIFKANGWRCNPADLEAESENFPMSDDVIFCGNEIEPYATVTPDNPPTDNKWDEIERRKAESVSLVRQLEELLDTSRDTLSAIEATATSLHATDPQNVVLQHYLERLQSDDIAQTIANWSTESIDSMDSIEWGSNLKCAAAAAAAAATASFSDNSDMEEFSTMTSNNGKYSYRK